MGGRGASSGAGRASASGSIHPGQKVTVRHSVYGTVTGTISRTNKAGTSFYVDNARVKKAGVMGTLNVPKTAVFSKKDIL